MGKKKGGGGSGGGGGVDDPDEKRAPQKASLADFLFPPAARSSNGDAGLCSLFGAEGPDHSRAVVPAASTSQSTPTRSTATELAYSIGATKKGGIPVSIETRKCSKVVVIENAEGDLKALLRDLQHALGTGGVIRGSSVEIQGDQHADRVRAFLVSSGCLVGVSRQVREEARPVSKASPKAAELRLDGSQMRGVDDFISKYGGSRANPPAEWRSAPTSKKDAEKKAAVHAALDAKEVKAMNPTDLKARLSARGLSTQGNKKELLARLLECCSA